MENPASWGRLERTLSEANKAWHKAQNEGIVGYSLPAYLAQSLRNAGLVNELEDSTVKLVAMAAAGECYIISESPEEFIFVEHYLARREPIEEFHIQRLLSDHGWIAINEDFTSNSELLARLNELIPTVKLWSPAPKNSTS